MIVFAADPDACVRFNQDARRQQHKPDPPLRLLTLPPSRMTRRSLLWAASRLGDDERDASENGAGS